ncbi:unnamed protein product [Moneuplotes crassus]|uniref:Cyclin N-terminal domain-containing protein n=1 Tax=Euplotes crassus TaxID=5936 RepID=A0AAD1Y622_EUPCR|nr:unnamed protein product [Moneuplotes crassus]
MSNYYENYEAWEKSTGTFGNTIPHQGLAIEDDLHMLSTRQNIGNVVYKEEDVHKKPIRCLRRFIFDWINYLGNKLKQKMETKQSAIALFDRIVANTVSCVKVIQKEKYLWGQTLLLISSKFSEPEHNCITIKAFIKVSSRANFPRKMIVNCERVICNILNWNLVTEPPVIFVDLMRYFKGTGNEIPEKDLEKYIQECYKITNKILYLTQAQTKDYKTQAVAAVMLARKNYGLYPIYEEGWEELFQISKRDIEHVLELYRNHKYSMQYSKKHCKKGKQSDKNANKSIFERRLFQRRDASFGNAHSELTHRYKENKSIFRFSRERSKNSRLEKDEESSISRIQKDLKESQMRVDTSLGRSIDLNTDYDITTKNSRKHIPSGRFRATRRCTITSRNQKIDMITSR